MQNNKNKINKAELALNSSVSGQVPKVFVEKAWQQANALAIESSNAYVAKKGLPLAKYRLGLK